MNKIGKITGKVIAAFMLLLTVAVFVFGTHFDGETKAAEKYFDALERKDQTAFDKFSEKSENVFDVRRKLIEQSGILLMEETVKAAGETDTPVLINDTDVDFKVEFPSGATIKPGGDDYKLPIKLTVYNDYNHVVFGQSIAHMTYIGGRWRVFEVDVAK